MKPSAKLGIAAVFLLLLGSALLWQSKQAGTTAAGDNADPEKPAPAAAKVTPESVELPDASPSDSTTPAKPAAGGRPDFRFERLADGRSLVTESVKTARAIHSADAQPEADLEALDSIFALYRWAYSENPEGGDNRELIAALTGENPRHLVFIPSDHPGLSAAGELLDRWGTPYFFHKISDQIIDVTSAGPDKRLWSRDDLTLGYTETFQAANSKP